MEMRALLADGMQTILMKLSLISVPRFRIWTLAPSTAEMSCMFNWIKNVRGSYNRHIMSSVSVKSDSGLSGLPFNIFVTMLSMPKMIRGTHSGERETVIYQWGQEEELEILLLKSIAQKRLERHLSVHSVPECNTYA